MEKETFLSDQIYQIFETTGTLKSRLDELAQKLKKVLGVQVYFCEIIGNRWSFFAGDMTLDIPQHRLWLNKKFGMMAGEIRCPEQEWTEAVEQVKNILNREKAGWL